MSPLPLVYTTRSDCEPEYLERKEKWYAERHAPDLIAVGFHSAQSFHSEIGTPFVCNVYEIPGTDIFLSQAYKHTRTNDPQRPEVLSKMSNLSAAVYEQVLLCLPPDRITPAADSPAAAITGPCLTTVRFDIRKGTEPRFVEWYRREEFPRLLHARGFAAGRLCRQGPRHPTLATSDPEWMVLLEWESTATARADGSLEDIVRRHEQPLPGALSRLAYNLLRRVFRLAREPHA